MVVSAPPSISTASLTGRLFNCRDQISLRADVLWRVERVVIHTQTWSEEDSKIRLVYWGLEGVVGADLSWIQPYEMTVEMSILLSGFFLLIALVR